jgi:Rrf2 family protein
MIKVNRQTDYAIRVVLALARHGSGQRISTRQIQEEMAIPAAFLQRIVADLARSTIVHTFPGREGGLELTRPIAKITLKQVIEAIDGPIMISDCLSSHKSECLLKEPCPVHYCWGRVQAAILSELDSVTFEELASERTPLPQQELLEAAA